MNKEAGSALMRTDGDDADVAAAAAGSRAAFSSLVRNHQMAVRAFVGRAVRDAEEVDDLAQDVFLAAHRGLSSFRGDAPFRYWLLGIARKQVAMHIRSRSSRRAAVADRLEQILSDIHGAAFEPTGPTLTVLDGQVLALRQCLSKLSAEGAELMTAYYERNDTAVRIAARQGKNVDAIRMTLMRLRRTLRACIERRMAAEVSDETA